MSTNAFDSLTAEVARQSQFLRTELGYQTDVPGSLRAAVEENQRMLREIERTLRGAGDQLGIVGWVTVLRRTWIALVALLGAAAGYLLNDVVHVIDSPPRGAAVLRAATEEGDDRPTQCGRRWTQSTDG